MNKKTLQELKEKLEENKKSLESELGRFAQKDTKLKGDWDTRYPRFDSGSLEEAADEVEEYSTLLSVEHNLELKLQDINSALEKIKGNKYGMCENCHEPINIKRLEICPEAKTCGKCK